MDKLGIVIPTINSASYIDLILSYYSAIEVPVTVFVDTKTTDHTVEIVARSGHKVEMIENPTERVGHSIEEMSRRMDTPWVLRIDDDELPTNRLVAFARWAADGHSDPDVYGFCRYQCAVSEAGEIIYHRLHDPQMHRQWRLYRPQNVRFTDQGHTPGFVLDDGISYAAAPGDALLIHLDWVVHSLEDRREKVARYDAHTPNDGSAWRDYYLADTVPGYAMNFSRLPHDDFRSMGRELQLRFPDRAVKAT